MEIKIPSRGPAIVPLKDGRWFDLWYDRNYKLWTLQLKDAEGNQIGPGYGGGAETFYNRLDAVDDIRDFIAGPIRWRSVQNPRSRNASAAKTRRHRGRAGPAAVNTANICVR